MGCAAALRMAAGGMRPIVLDRGDLGQGASGVNAGTLSLQIKRVRLMPYALEGHRLWEAMGDAVGFRKTGGYTLAFNDREAELLAERQGEHRLAPVEQESEEALQRGHPWATRRCIIGRASIP